MKILITADLHAGLSNKLNDIIWSIDIIRKYANKHGIEHVFILGDLFHDRVNIGIDVLHKVHDQLRRSCSLQANDRNNERLQTWHCFPGNHDMFLKNSWETNSIHHLAGLINIYEEVTKITLNGMDIHIFPFKHSEYEYMKILKTIKHGPNDILLTHIGVSKAILNQCFLLRNWSLVNFEETKFKRVFTGHFHCYQEIGKVIYPGSCCKTVCRP